MSGHTAAMPRMPRPMIRERRFSSSFRLREPASNDSARGS
jgi:hypothetical protein